MGPFQSIDYLSEVLIDDKEMVIEGSLRRENYRFI